MMFLVGRGMFLVLVIWVVSFFLIWRLMRHSGHSESTSEAINNYGRNHVKAKIFLDTQGNSDSKSDYKIIPVFITEEHHEVVKYWYSAVEKQYIQPKDNILFHIDAHADGGTPLRWNLAPLFRNPNNPSEIRKLMQGNDRFVVSAVLTGLITRYIWVRPPWNTETFDNRGRFDYISIEVKIGTTYTVTELGTTVLELCACTSSIMYNINNYCFMNNASDFEDVDGIPIQESQCAMRTSLLIEVTSPAKAVELLKSGTWITADNSLVLDVDEDYYGVEPGGQLLYDAGLTDEQIDRISAWSSKLLCAGNTHHERQIDHFFHDIIQTIIDLKSFHSRKKEKWRQNKIYWEQLTSMFKGTIHEHSLSDLLCYSKAMSLFVLNRLVVMLAKMTKRQLNALGKVGLCLEGSPQTYGFTYGETIRLCSGYNRPNESMVMFFTPSHEDIKQRTRELEQMLKEEYFVPGVVTICRSVRDGYTPRNVASVIEKDILRVLENQYSRVESDSIYYDRDLLSGQDGHHSRY